MHFPLLYDFDTTGTSRTTVATLHEHLDRSRAFRVAGVQGTITAYKRPLLVQFELFKPAPNTDNAWATPVMAVATGVPHRFRYRIPANVSGWFPSETADTTNICQLVNICTASASVGAIKACVTLRVVLGPFEPSDACPRVQSFVPHGRSNSVEPPVGDLITFSDDSSEDELVPSSPASSGSHTISIVSIEEVEDDLEGLLL